MKVIDLTFRQRVFVVQIVASQKGNVAQMRDWSRLLDKIIFTPEESAAVGFEVKEEDGTIQWNVALVKELNPKYTLSLEDADAKMLSSIIERSEIFNPISDRWVLGLVDKLK